MKIDISVIIPTYNAEHFIKEALDSVVAQTFKGVIEIIVVDDCSADRTLEIVETFKKEHPSVSMHLFKQEKNMRQGTARNRGLREAGGEYVFFLDGDDLLDARTLDAMHKKAESEACDFVVCDWAYYYEDRGLVYVNNDTFLFNGSLIGKECERLLEAATYFTVNKLYKRDFLVNNDIRYGEGYIYEDYEFYVETAQKAEKIGLIQNPYYRVRVNEYSTTKTNRKTMIHLESLVKAVDHTLKKFVPRDEYSTYHLYKYIMKKTMSYVRHRAPFGQKRRTVKRILSLLNRSGNDYCVPNKVNTINHFYFKKRYVQNQEIDKIMMLDLLRNSGPLRPFVSKGMKVKRSLAKQFDRLDKLKKNKQAKKQIETLYEEHEIDSNIVLFLGFDYRYAGNSKYLFDYVAANNHEGKDYYFVTANQDVPRENRVVPRSMHFYELLSKAKVVIAESWIPLDFKKKEGQEWIQLWHGTPYKKLLFDSHEKYVSGINKDHKKNKQRDISRWDYLLADSEAGKEKFASAFAYEKEKILTYGYPRVQWLKENKDNADLKNEIRSKLGVPSDKKVILYVPTWRDYNFKKKVLDLDYLFDIEKMGKELSEEYVILNKQHSMGRFKTADEFVITPSDEIDVQELILVSDLIISDYSSIIFDGMAIDIPFYLYINDFEKYEDARGVYPDMDQILRPFYVESEQQIIDGMKMTGHELYQRAYQEVKQAFASKEMDSNKRLSEKINELLTKQ